MTRLLVRGMLFGLLAGLLGFGWSRVCGEPPLDRAIAFEHHMSQARGETPEPDLVSRTTQAGIGLFTGIVVFSVALGGLFSLAFAVAYGRLGALGPRGTAALLALLGFVVVAVVPALKYPPNPPAVGDPATIGPRTALYFTMLAISLATATFATGLARRLSARLGTWNAILCAALAFIAVIALAECLLPGIDEVPAGFPAAVLWRFRLAALGLHAILWGTLGIGFGIAAERALGGDDGRRTIRL